MRKKLSTVLALTTFGLSTCVWAGGEKIELDKAPAAVQAAVKKALGKAELEKLVKETEAGKTVYEAEFEVDDIEHSVKLSEAGDVLEEEAEVDVKKLPDAVTRAVKLKYASGEIEKASEVKADGKTYYELDVEVGDDEREIKIDAAGKVISDEVEKDDDDHDDHDHKDDMK